MIMRTESVGTLHTPASRVRSASAWMRERIAVRPRQRAGAQVGAGLVGRVFRHEVPDVPAQVLDAGLARRERAIEPYLEGDVALPPGMPSAAASATIPRYAAAGTLL